MENNIIEFKYINIEYPKSDIDYLDDLFSDLDINSEEIVEFFKLDNFGEKVNIKLFDNLDYFREYLKGIRKKETEDWICGNTAGTDIQVLLLSELRKTRSHENDNIDDLKKLILHEFVHAMQYKKYGKNNLKWIDEGMATFLSGQYDKGNIINCTFDELINKSNCPYSNYDTMFKFVYNKYGLEYIESIIKDDNLALSESEKLFNELLKDRKIKK